jgi:hypothetical protein
VVLFVNLCYLYYVVEFSSFQSENRALNTRGCGFRLIGMLNSRKLGTVKRRSLDSAVGIISEHCSKEMPWEAARWCCISMRFLYVCVSFVHW